MPVLIQSTAAATMCELLLLLVVVGAWPQHTIQSSPDLQTLLYPVTPSEFLRETWQKQHLVISDKSSQKAELFQNIWSLRRSEEYLWAKKQNLKYGKDVELARKGNKLFKDEPDGVKPLPLTLDSVRKSYTEGSTVIIGELLQHPTLYAWIAELERDFAVSASVNSYISPGSTEPGFNYHWDEHDSFITQHQGSKIWEVCGRKFPLHTPSVMLGLSGLDLDCRNTTLRTGDVLYMPFGTFHKVYPTKEASVHLTLALNARQQAISTPFQRHFNAISPPIER